MKIKVVIAGGTGFVGQGIIQLLSPEKFEIHSLSRHDYVSRPTDKTIYHVVDLANSSELHNIIADADWVIDVVGILLPNPIKGVTYRNSSYEPAKYLIDQLIKQTNTNFLFVSANSGPFFMKPYLNAKRAVEKLMNQSLSGRAYIVYPGIIYDKSRLSSFIPGILLSHLVKVPYFKKLRPISRQSFSLEIQRILNGKHSHLEEKI
ncbi:NAD-dependent epimerase/dehydratase family protein [Weissella cibaria]|uniref:NAD-dependent epimerase/dehydratase family protein n=1 Tax=Weissella cibaria TaxID=137591 RepID=UPI0034E84538